MGSPRIEGVEWGTLEGRRPRAAGCNARLGAHGDIVRVPIVRVTTDDGASGFGWCRAGAEHAQELLAVSLDTLFSPERGIGDAWRAFEFPLWDLMGQRAGQPVYALVASLSGRTPPPTLAAPCYDTSLYIDDLHLASTEAAAELIADEARAGYAKGHRGFKLKVGRGARHMPLAEGTARDVAVIRAVRGAIGPQATLMLDANNGYNLNLAKQVLEATADCRIYWLEEAFHEDAVLYEDLKAWLAQHGLPVLIADGEGEASSHLLDWAKRGLIDVIQYDILHPGLARWLPLAKQLDGWRVRTAPHHYGSGYGNYAACHLAPAAEHFAFVEWDEAVITGLDVSGYAIEAGHVRVPDEPGFGLALDEAVFRQAVENGGGSLWW